MTNQTESFDGFVERRQLVDWSAAYWAGLLSGLAFLSMYLVVAPLTNGSSLNQFLRYVASLLTGLSAIEEGIGPGLTLGALIAHLIISFIFALLIVIVLHRWGFIVGILLGAVLGLIVYAITIFPASTYFPWFSEINDWFLILTHAVFGAAAGGVYEFLEVEEYELIQE
ncbi:MAG: hypothetical protein AAF702_48015 [Chloroflexota bacterium]